MIQRILDTDHVSLLERGHQPIKARLASFPPDTLAVSVITVEEMVRGRLAVLAKRSESERRVHAYKKFMETVLFFSTVPVIPFDLDCENTLQELRSQKIRVGTQDLQIAATALVHNVILVTRNRQDFERIPKLVLEDWSVF